MSPTSGTEFTRQRWAVLAIGMLGLVAACAFQYGLPYLIPAFQSEGLSLTQSGLLVSAPVLGVLCSLVLWGALTDRVGERWVLTAGLAGSAAALLAASTVRGSVLLGGLLFAGGASSACVQVGSGRLILGWFPVHERGLAMGLRQTGQPLGVGLAALVLPVLGGRDVSTALLFLAGCCAFAGLLIGVGVRDAAQEPVTAVRVGTPYRTGYLWRIHLASTLLVVPQFTVAAFAFAYLVGERHWSTSSAGPLLAVAQIGGAAIRLAAGWWSDRAGSRLRPMRTLCLLIGAALILLAAGVISGSAIAVLAVVLAAVLTVSTNGLAFTAVAERAGRAWAGRALGVQNTAQNLAAAATPPVIAAVITAVGHRHGYAVAFSLIVVLPLLAALAVPVGQEHVTPAESRPEPESQPEPEPEPEPEPDRGPDRGVRDQTRSASASAGDSKPGSH